MANSRIEEIITSWFPEYEGVGSVIEDAARELKRLGREQEGLCPGSIWAGTDREDNWHDEGYHNCQVKTGHFSNHHCEQCDFEWKESSR